MSYKTSTAKTVFFFISLLILFICISLLTVFGFMQNSVPLLGEANSVWSFASDITSATLGIAVAVSGAFVAIIIAQRTVDISVSASKREAQNHVYQRIDSDLRSVNGLQTSIENILFKAEVVNELIENSDLLMMLENSFALSEKKDDKEQKIVNCAGGLNLYSIQNFYYETDKGKEFNQKLSSLLNEISDDMVKLADNIDFLLDSDPIVASWQTGVNKYLSEYSDSKDTRTVRGLVKQHLGLEKHTTALNGEMTVSLFNTFSSLLRKNALKIKYNGNGSLDYRVVLSPLLSITNEVFKYKLLHHQHILNNSSDVKVTLQALDILPIAIFICQEYLENKHKVLNMGGSVLSFLYLVSFVNHSSVESEAKALVKMYVSETPELEEKEIDSLYRLVSDRIFNRKKPAHKVFEYFINDFIKHTPAHLFETEVLDRSINKTILHERELHNNRDSRELMLSKTLDFFETFPAEIRSFKLESNIFGQGDFFEPLYIYWLNRNDMAFTGFKKAKDAILFYIYDSSPLDSYVYSEKDIQHIESLLALLHDTYWDENKHVMDLTQLVVNFRRQLMKYENDGDVIPLVELEGLIKKGVA